MCSSGRRLLGDRVRVFVYFAAVVLLTWAVLAACFMLWFWWKSHQVYG